MVPTTPKLEFQKYHVRYYGQESTFSWNFVVRAEMFSNFKLHMKLSLVTHSISYPVRKTRVKLKRKRHTFQNSFQLTVSIDNV